MNADDFAGRLAVALDFEAAVRADLVSRGWAAEPFGQGQLTDGMRKYLRELKTPVRHMPDIIAAKRFAARTVVVFVDAKAGETWKRTGRHAIEAAAVDAAEKWIELAGEQCPYYFVFSDGGTITPATARECGHAGRYSGSGSGTPFLLVPTSACTDVRARFGDRQVTPS